MKFLMVFLSLFFAFFLHAGERPIIFAPIPLSNTHKVFEDFNPMVTYLEKHLGESIALRYEKKYDDIIALFQANQIDIAYFGPLPFATLRKQFPAAKPLVTFLESDGEEGYRCVLVKFAQDTLDAQHPEYIKVALTQPLSTCGYTKTKMLIHNELNLSLEELRYRYVGRHDEVALGVLRGHFLIGGMRESIAKSYASLGLERIATSELLPGFTLVVNTQTLSEKQIETIKRTLLNTPKEVYQAWGKDISYGMVEAKEALFEKIHQDLLHFSIPSSGNF